MSPKGILANIKAGLALKFQFNPESVVLSKEVGYKITNVTGWDHPDIIFEHGGVKRIKFDLVFDKLSNAGFSFGPEALAGRAGLPTTGVEGIRAVIESFWYPERPALSFSAPPKFKAPPRGILVLGPRFWEVIVEGGDTKDILFSKSLTPVRMQVPMSFIVVEEGPVAKINSTRRAAMAKGQSILAAAELASDVFSIASAL